jgi:hypothetical protein
VFEEKRKERREKSIEQRQKRIEQRQKRKERCIFLRWITGIIEKKLTDKSG